jgi:hypothetical protein
VNHCANHSGDLLAVKIVLGFVHCHQSKKISNSYHTP